MEYGHAMKEDDWNWYIGEGLEVSKEMHLAFEVALSTGKLVCPKHEFKKAFAITGYINEHRLGRAVLQNGSMVVTSNLVWAHQKGGVIVVYTKSGSLYELEAEEMNRGRDYLSPEDTDKTAEELNELMNKYFNIKKEVAA